MKRMKDFPHIVPGEPIQIGEACALHSKILDADFCLTVRLPRDYAVGKRRYPVIVMLDGGGHFLHMTGILDILERSNQVPEMIYVGINLPERWLHSTPTAMADPKTEKNFGKIECGGAEQFADCLEHEIIPFIDRTYRTEPYRMLGGHSLTGLFAAWVLMTRPEPYRAYFATTPSMWWNQGEWVKKAELLIPKIQGRRDIALNVGNEGNRHDRHIRRFAKLLKEKAPARVRSDFRSFPHETHGTVPHLGFWHALRHFFPDWSLPYPYDKISVAAIRSHFGRLSRRHGFEAQPTRPFLTGIANHLLQKGKLKKAEQILEYGLVLYSRSPELRQAIKDLRKAQ